jgi:hypothetical protein
LTLIWSMYCGAVTDTAGSRWMRSPAARDSGAAVSLETMRSALARAVIALVKDDFRPAASTATNATSPMPTMRVAAVIAVRAGLRVELSRASSPVACPSRSSGQPTSAASGRTMYRASMATPTKTSSDPVPIAVSRADAAPPPNSPCSSRAVPKAPTSATRITRRRLGAGASGAVSSRMAATGETRVARTAGITAAAAVTPMPTVRPIAMVRGSRPTAARGMPIPAASNSVPSRREKPRPASSPATEAARPRTSASAATLASTCPRVAPSARSSANSRRRCATVIENVLKMMNAPTSSAAPENARSAGFRNAPMLSLISFDLSAVACAPVLTSRLRGSTARRLRTRSSGDTPERAAATMLVTFPSSRFHDWTSPRGAMIIVAPPIEATSPKSTTPTRRAGWMPVRLVTPTRAPTARWLSSASLRLIATSPEPAGKRPETIRVGLNGGPTMARTIAGANCGSIALPRTTSDPGW